MSLKLDKIDLNILDQLQRNARVSIKEISRKIHLSSNAVTGRIKRLEDDGYIQRYTTVLNNTMVDKSLECFTAINLTENNHQTAASFLTYLNSIPEVYEFYRLNCVYDFFLRIITVDIYDYQNILINKLSKLNCVSGTKTFMVLSDMTGSNIVDLSHLLKRLR